MGNRLELLMLILPFYPIFAGIFGYWIGKYHKKVRDKWIQLAVLLQFAGIIILAAANPVSVQLTSFGGFGLSFHIDSLRALLLPVFSFAWLITALFSEEYFFHHRNRNRYYLFYLITFGAVTGVVLAADWFTFFLFFELMSFASFVWVAQEETREALRAAQTYLGISVIGGLSMLMGILLLYVQSNSLSFDMLSGYGESKGSFAAAMCILAGAAAKAGAFPLHVWLPKAHPAAPAPASALLSGVLTKTGVLGIMILLFQMGFGQTILGTVILFGGILTTLAGAVLALVCTDLKRILACSSISQIGFILIGLSLFNQPGVTGAVWHMVNHTLLKLVLFTAAGVIFMNLHELDLNKIQGFGRKKPLLHFVFLSGAAGISGIPLGNAYFSKTLIHEGITERAAQLRAMGILWHGQDVTLLLGTEKLFLLAGGFTAAYMAKLYICIFIQKNQDLEKQRLFDRKKTYCSALSGIAITFGAFTLWFLGIFTALRQRETYFAFENLKGIGISLCIGILLYFIFVKLPYYMIKKYRNLLPEFADLEEAVYRPVLLSILPLAGGFFSRILDRAADDLIVLFRKSILRDSPVPREPEEGTIITNTVGGWLEEVQQLLNRTVLQNKKLTIDFRHRLASFQEVISETNTLISRSLSFGLILVLLGLLSTLLYLLL